MATADVAAALDAARRAAACVPGVFDALLATLGAHSHEHAALVTTLATQLGEALEKLPGGAGPAQASVSAPKTAVDISAASCVLKAVSFTQPRGKFDVAILGTGDSRSIVLLNKDGVSAVTLPPAVVEHVLVLEKPPEATASAKAASQRTVYIMLPLAHPGVEHGKAALTALVLSCSSGEGLSCSHPVTGEALSDSAPVVLAQVLSAACGKPVEAPATSSKSFRSSRGLHAVAAHVKVTPGSLYPLRCGLAFVSTSKAVFLPTSRWDGITVGRGGAGGANSTFDLLVSTAGTTVGTEFSLISREELPLIQEYVTERKRVLDKKAAAEAPGGHPAGGENAQPGAGPDAPAVPAAAAGSESEEDSDEDDEDFMASDGAGDSGGSGGSSDEEDEGGCEADARAEGSDDSDDQVDVSAFAIKKQRTE